MAQSFKCRRNCIKHKGQVMKLKQAFQIVIDLASENILDNYQVSLDPEILQPEQNLQKKALDMVIAQANAMAETGMLDE